MQAWDSVKRRDSVRDSRLQDASTPERDVTIVRLGLAVAVVLLGTSLILLDITHD